MAFAVIFQFGAFTGASFLRLGASGLVGAAFQLAPAFYEGKILDRNLFVSSVICGKNRAEQAASIGM